MNTNLTIEEIEVSTDIYDSNTQSELIGAISRYSLPRIVEAVVKIDSKRRSIQSGLWRRMKGFSASKADWSDPREADGIPVLARKPVNVTKINYKSHTPFDRTIVNQKANYFVGKRPEITEDDSFMQWAERNNLHTLISELAQDASAMGEGISLLYSPEGDADLYITKEYPYNGVVLYNQDTNEPEYGLLYYLRSDDEYVAYWYTRETVTKLGGQKDAFVIIEDERPHLIDGVPLIDWQNNSERMADTEMVIGLADLYDIVDSDFLSELGQLRLAYLLLKGMGLDGEDTSENIFDRAASAPGFEGLAKATGGLTDTLRNAGAFTSDNPDADVKFITKEIAFDAIQYAKQSLKERIFQGANSYDPVTVQGADSNVTAFQIRMKLHPLEQATSEMETWFAKSFMRMVHMVRTYYATYRNIKMADDIEITFKRNNPSNIIQDMIDARAAGFMMSQAQIAKRLPFSIDQEENAAELLNEADSVLIDTITNDTSR